MRDEDLSIQAIPEEEKKALAEPVARPVNQELRQFDTPAAPLPLQVQQLPSAPSVNTSSQSTSGQQTGQSTARTIIPGADQLQQAGAELADKQAQALYEQGEVEGLRSDVIAAEQKRANLQRSQAFEEFDKKTKEEFEDPIMRQRIRTEGAIEAAKREVDPEQWSKTMSAGRMIANVVASLFGGFAEGWTGGRVKSNAAQLMQNYIQRNIRAQEQNIQNLKDAAAAEKQMLGYLDKRLGDRQQAKQVLGTMLETEALNQLKYIEQSTNKPVVAAKTRLAISAIEEERLKRDTDLAKAQAVHETKSESKNVSKSFASQKSSGGTGAAAGGAQAMSKGDREKLGSLDSAKQALADYNRRLAAYGGGGIGSSIAAKLPKTEAAELEDYRQAVAAQVAQGMGIPLVRGKAPEAILSNIASVSDDQEERGRRAQFAGALLNRKQSEILGTYGIQQPAEQTKPIRSTPRK
jgi:hypothetical protein